jgi:hypothetical protein
METAFVLVIFEDLIQAAFQLIHRYTPSAGFEFVDNHRLWAIKTSEATETAFRVAILGGKQKFEIMIDGIDKSDKLRATLFGCRGQLSYRTDEC